MRLFEHRPFCAACAVYLISALICYQLNFQSTAIVFLICGVFAIAFISCMVFFKKHRRLFLRLSAFAIAALIAASGIWGYQKIANGKLADFTDKKVQVVVEINEVAYSSAYITYAQGKIISADGDKVSINAALEIIAMPDLKAGDVLSAKAEFRALDGSGEKDGYHYRKGAIACLTDFKDTEITGSHTSLSLLCTNLRLVLSSRIRECAPTEAGNFYAALLLGEKAALNESVIANFRALGISHTLALSGMHLSILILSLDKLLNRFGVHKFVRIGITLVLTVFYTAITGFSPSICRASLMLIATLVTYVLGKNHDAMTALFVSMVLLCAIHPYNVCDIGMWLSGCATFGILILQDWRVKPRELMPAPMPPRTTKRRIWIVKCLRLIGENLAITLAATVATLPIIAIVFGETSLLAIPANLLFNLPINIALVFALIALAFGGSIPFIGTALTAYGDFLLFLTQKSAAIPDITVSLNYPWAKIIFTAMAIASLAVLCIFRKSRLPVLCIIAASVTVFAGFYLAETAKQDAISRATYIGSENGAYFVVQRENKLIVYDASNETGALRQKLLSHIEAEHKPAIDHYILSHYSYRVESALEDINYTCPIKKLWLAPPQTENEIAYFEAVKTFTDAYAIPYEEFPYDAPIVLADAEVSFLPSFMYENSNQPNYAMHLS